MIQNAYVHIPFCKSKCKYCSFVSYSGSGLKEQKTYVDSLLKEIDFFYNNETLKTLYVGGGTPSLLQCEDLKRVVKRFSFCENPEITIEINPETVDLNKLSKLKEMGFNRISAGIQSFDDNILKSIGRIHTSQKAEDAIKNSFKAGFENVSTDFIYGLPMQSLEHFCQDLKLAVEHGVTHISLYGLKIEEGCYFCENPPIGIADDDLQADMYLSAIKILENAGYEHYEISNFCKSGFQSKHNLNYWNDKSYYGFGAAAHGYDAVSHTRYENFSVLEKYEKNYMKKAAMNLLTDKQILEETIFLGFRRCEGLDIKSINRQFDIDFDKQFDKVLKKYLSTGHLIKTNKGYRLSNEGFLLSTLILSDFLC